MNIAIAAATVSSVGGGVKPESSVSAERPRTIRNANLICYLVRAACPIRLEVERPAWIDRPAIDGDLK